MHEANIYIKRSRARAEFFFRREGKASRNDRKKSFSMMNIQGCPRRRLDESQLRHCARVESRKVDLLWSRSEEKKKAKSKRPKQTDMMASRLQLIFPAPATIKKPLAFVLPTTAPPIIWIVPSSNVMRYKLQPRCSLACLTRTRFRRTRIRIRIERAASHSRAETLFTRMGRGKEQSRSSNAPEKSVLKVPRGK